MLIMYRSDIVVMKQDGEYSYILNVELVDFKVLILSGFGENVHWLWIPTFSRVS